MTTHLIMRYYENIELQIRLNIGKLNFRCHTENSYIIT